MSSLWAICCEKVSNGKGHKSYYKIWVDGKYAGTVSWHTVRGCKQLGWTDWYASPPEDAPNNLHYLAEIYETQSEAIGALARLSTGERTYADWGKGGRR